MTNENLNKEEIYKKYDFQMNIEKTSESYLFSLFFKDSPIAEIERTDFDELDSVAVLFRYAGDSKHNQSVSKATAYSDALQLVLQSQTARKDANLIYTLQQFFSQSNQRVYSSENDGLFLNTLSTNSSKKPIQKLNVFDEITLESLRDQLIVLYYELSQAKTNASSESKNTIVVPNME